MRVAAVSYLNTLPLVQGLPWPIARMFPADLQGAKLNDYDLILAPLVTSFRHPEWQIIPGAPIIGCTGAVQSVRLELPTGKTIESVETIQLSPESQTSNLLLKVLLKKKWGRDLRTLTFTTDDGRPTTDDGFVIIGDRAFTTPPGPNSIDLGEAWHQWTGLPFVFASWMTRNSVPPALAAQLSAILDANLLDVATLVRGLDGDEAALERYFVAHLDYRCTESHCEAMQRFHRTLRHSNML